MSVRYNNFLNEVRQNLKEIYERNLQEASLYMVGELRKTNSGQKSGRVYKVPGTQAEYTASAPGESPARRTGDLAKSFGWEKKNDTTYIVGNDRKYALHLEKGTSKMAPRPYFVSTFNANTDKIKELLGRRG